MFALAEWLARNRRDRPDAAAIVFAEGRLSWLALAERAAALPLAGSGPVVAAAGNERLALLAHAASLAGRAFFPLNPRLPQPMQDRLAALVGPGGAAELIVATSGSSGDAKAVMLSGANLRAHVAASRARLGLDSGDVWLACLPLFHIGGLAILWRCAEAGAAAVVHDGFDAERLMEDLSRRRVTHLSLVPAMLARLVDAGARPPAALRVCLVGGAALPAPLAERALAAGWPVWPTYGMSEAGSQVATLAGARPGWRAGTVGRPLDGLAVDIRQGRIRVRGAAVMLGYANPEMRPGEGLADGWFETGDLGEWDEDGNLVVLGRGDDVFVTGGENVHPQAVEEIAARCPGVAAVAVTARPDPVWGDLLVAVVVGEIAPDAFLTWCRRHLPGHMRPRAVVKAESLPLKDTGKLDRSALRKLVSSGGQNR